MASIVEKQNGTYLIRVFCGRDENGKQITKSTIFKPSSSNLPYAKLTKEMNNFIRIYEEEVHQEFNNIKSKPNNPKKMTFEVFCQEYIKIKKEVLSPNTYPFYCRIINEHLIPLYGKIRLEEFRVYHIQQYIQYASNMERRDRYVGKILPQTVKRYTSVLRSILSLAYKMEYIENDISMSRRLDFPKATSSEIEVYTVDEVRKILDALMDEPIHIRTIIELAIFTGCRRAEIVGLKWADIDLENNRLHVKRSIYKIHGQKAQEKEPKSKNGIRSMIIPDRLCETLKEYKAHQERYKAYLGAEWKDLDYVFTEANGYVMNPHTPTKQFRNFLKRHDIRQLKFHGLRHTSATFLLASGCDIKTVSARLGHADIETTGIYVHVQKATDLKAAKTFDSI